MEIGVKYQTVVSASVLILVHGIIDDFVYFWSSVENW